MPAHKIASFLLPSCAISVVFLFFALQSKMVSFEAVVPTDWDPARASVVYAVAASSLTAAVQVLLSKYPGVGATTQQFLAIMLLLTSVAVAGLYLYLNAGIRASSPGDADGPVPACIAMVGPSNVGKTVFLARAYSILQRRPFLDLFMLAPTKESWAVLHPIVERIESERSWPLGTAEPSKVPFELCFGARSLLRFHWLDLPGGTFSSPEKWDRAAEVFMSQVRIADAVMMLIDAEDLVRAGNFEAIPYSEVYYTVTRQYFVDFAQYGETTEPAALAVIVTKTCKIQNSNRDEIVAKLAPLCAYWRESAKQAVGHASPVEIFISSAVVTNASAPDRIPPAPVSDRPI